MSDEELLLAYYAGDDDAFADLFSRYMPSLIRYAERRLPANAAGQFETARDLAQLSLFKVSRTRDRPSTRWPSGERTVAAWIFTVHRRTVVDYLRRYHPEIDETDSTRGGDGDGDGDASSLDARIAGAVADPQEHASKAEDKRDLMDCISRLPGPQQEIVHLFCAGLEFKEIAWVVGQSYNTVYVSFRRSLPRLAQCLRGKGF